MGFFFFVVVLFTYQLQLLRDFNWNIIMDEMMNGLHDSLCIFTLITTYTDYSLYYIPWLQI